MDFFSVIGVRNEVEEVPMNDMFIPITLQKPVLPATKILDTPHYSFLGLPITLANRRAVNHEFGYYDNGMFKCLDFARIEYTGRMVFNKPSSCSNSAMQSSKFADEPWFTIDYIDELIDADQQPMPEVPTLVATWVSTDPHRAFMQHAGHHYYGDDGKWHTRAANKWVQTFVPGHEKLKFGWYKFEFKYSL